MIPKPTEEEVVKYIKKWDLKENYVLQENSLNKLFGELIPQNKNIEDILLKCSTLNDFYSTNIFSIYSVAKHILYLNIDSRLSNGDLSLIEDIANVTINGKKKRFYSFATKYCSHHNNKDFPIYDSYVDKILGYFRDLDCFCEFKKYELKDYKKFTEVLYEFKSFYKLEKFDLKDIDRYLWQLGKEYFPNNY
ncbi:hypothetical protein NE604_06960 [Anaerofustis stercorihominis]|uniref:Uncharacterized protein n=1 Tax=Anaerofustis stercorihominis DSM 17244 TaxID=445971 RepID=B1CAX3_9FIRM|nr:hypothetical protein [Anaerofustis stercorihominis]EDS71420.1 hypothetical protein ANASTE_01122 [Anaerofustis stercorihominis DSM 17244]MCQ4795372.1 hypothetical protein [Anaerofustis stercorihominis]